MIIKYIVKIGIEGVIMMYDLVSLSNQNAFSEKQVLDIFEKYGTVKKYGEGESLFNRGEEANGVYYVKNGKIRCYFSFAEGEEFTLLIIKKGLLIGEDTFMTPPKRTFDTEVVTKATLIYMPTHVLISKCMEQEIALYQIMGFFMKKILLLANHLISALQLNGNKKLAFLLLKLYSENDEKLCYTHEQLAIMTGLTRVATTKILNDFEAKGLIKTQYKLVEIISTKGLMDILNNNN